MPADGRKKDTGTLMAVVENRVDGRDDEFVEQGLVEELGVVGDPIGSE